MIRSPMARLALSCCVVTVIGDKAATAQSACSSNAPQLTIYHAGSLTAEFTAVEQLFTAQTGTCITDISAGSVDAARRVTSGQQPADIFAAADYLDIELLLKPAKYANFDIVFAQTEMVLAYTTSSRNAATIASAGASFNPPGSVPQVAANWYDQLTAPNVLIGGSNPFQDPSGYRADLIFQLAAEAYPVPGLYNTFLQHYTIDNRPNDALGTTYDYIFTYASAALAASKANPSYRYATLPPAVSLSDPTQEQRYNQVVSVVPGLQVPGSAAHVAIPGTQVTFGLTILETATHRATAIQFLQLLLSSQGIALQTADGPTPIYPPIVSAVDYERLPSALKQLVSIR